MKIEVAVPNSPYGLSGRKKQKQKNKNPLNLNVPHHSPTHPYFFTSSHPAFVSEGCLHTCDYQTDKIQFLGWQVSQPTRPRLDSQRALSRKSVKT